MKNLSFHVNYDNKVYTYNSGAEAMIFDYGINNEIDRKYGIKALEEYVALAYKLYLTDDNPTPLGTLCDYVAQHWKKLKAKNKYEILDDFIQLFKE